MSTSWYFECLNHDPALRSDGEFTQHTEDDAYAAAIRLAHIRPLDPEAGYPSIHHFGDNARRFLLEHPECQLGLVNEYGDHRPLPDRLSLPTEIGTVLWVEATDTRHWIVLTINGWTKLHWGETIDVNTIREVLEVIAVPEKVTAAEIISRLAAHYVELGENPEHEMFMLDRLRRHFGLAVFGSTPEGTTPNA